ncbi:MAG: adenosylmethionine--8-amino-7-oxononanoate transaminase [Clostridium sp.]
MQYREELEKKDLEYIWHPASQMKDYETLKPIIIKEGKGIYLYDIEGKEYMDCISSWWCNLFGHANERINKAIVNQINSIEHVIFANFSHIPAIELSEKLVKLTKDNLNKVFFADNGSSAVEIALKMSFQYHYQNGNKTKTKFVTLENAYHGETVGALSVGGIDEYSKIYAPMMMDTVRVQGPDCINCKFEKSIKNCQCECFKDMEKVLKSNHENIAGVIIEPMIQGAGGMKIYKKDYLIKLRRFCDKYDIHLIADEIAVGFGRTGKMFAMEHSGVYPDLMCLSKGLSGGYMPMSVVMATNKIYKCFYDDYNKNKAFPHSHTYSGNPMGCAIGVEILKIFEEDNVLEKVNKIGVYINKKIEEELGRHKNVSNIRSLGIINAFDIVENKKDKSLFKKEDRIGYKIYIEALKRGLLLRPMGNIFYFNPPYIIKEEEIDKAVQIIKESIIKVLGE